MISSVYQLTLQHEAALFVSHFNIKVQLYKYSANYERITSFNIQLSYYFNIKGQTWENILFSLYSIFAPLLILLNYDEGRVRAIIERTKEKYKRENYIT